MVRLFPSAEEIKKWSSLSWVTYLSGVTVVLTSLFGIVSWSSGLFSAFQQASFESEYKPEIESLLPYPNPSGLLGIRFIQNGKRIRAVPTALSEFVDEYHYSYDVSISSGPFQIHVPRFSCNKDVDAYNAGVLVRVESTARKGDIFHLLQNDAPSLFEEAFPPASGYAGPRFVQTELIYEEPRKYEHIFGVNHYSEERFAEKNEDFVTIAVNSVVNVASGKNHLVTGEPFFMLVGAQGTSCLGRPRRQDSINGDFEFFRVLFR